MKSKFLHPILFGVYPVVMLLAYNIEGTQAADALRSLVISLLGAIVILLFFRFLFRDESRAALAASLSLILFFSYGHVYNYLEQVNLLGIALGRHRLLFPLWIGLYLIGLVWITRRGKVSQTIHGTLNVIAAVALIFPLAQLGLFEMRTLQAESVGQAADPLAAQLHLPAGQPAPDIYYIILDGYSRDDMLQKFNKLGNSPFLDQLSQLGFYVARCSQSNYAQTELSLSSSLNFNYLDSLGNRYVPGNTSRVGLPDLIKHSQVRRALENMGYTTVAFETGFDPTQLEDAGHYLSGKTFQGINDFENLLIRTTAGRVLAEGVASLNLRPDWEARDQEHRDQVLFTLGKLPGLPEMPGPKFVFAHVVAPHWPHVFGPNGEPVHERPDSLTGYRDQVVFLNKRVIPILVEIINRSKTPPIIIMQGDHGAVIESPERRMAILNAYYLPGDGARSLYESISPVNSFRVIFNHYFGGSIPLLEDTSFYSRYETPYDFQIVPNQRPGCQGG